MLYRLEQRIHTLAKNFVGSELLTAPEFTEEGVTFSSWVRHPSNEMWTNKYWLATTEIDTRDIAEAWQLFWDKLSKSIPRICVVSQCYTEHLGQPLLIRRSDLDIAFVRWTHQRDGTGLVFGDNELKAFKSLMTDSRIPDEFFWYWNDATNSTGYASKLLLMLSAVETLVNKPTTKGRPEKDYDKLVAILGPELKEEFWGKEGNSTDALRHRLAHGRYFTSGDAGKDYLELLQRKIIAYLNDAIFTEKLIKENIVHPQRHPTDNMDESRFFLRSRGSAALSLIDVAADLEKNFDNPEHYEYVSAEESRETFLWCATIGKCLA